MMKTSRQIIPSVRGKVVLVGFILWCVLFFGIHHTSSYAYPTLQLDIMGGTYDPITETIISPGTKFTLIALLEENKSNFITDTYYISAALAPKRDEAGSVGSFSFNGIEKVATRDMVYGTPPLETIVDTQGWDKGDLPSHGIFDTYFAEFGFQFSPLNRATAYDTAVKTGYGLTPNPLGSMYYATFNIDTSRLNQEYVLHFDLYNTKLKSDGDIDITQFAPFSHDAQSVPVPEAATIFSLGIGLAGFLLNRNIGIRIRRK